jgi:hypothetical protein
MSTRNLPGGKERPARKADLTAICENVGVSTSHNPVASTALHYGVRIEWRTLAHFVLLL